MVQKRPSGGALSELFISTEIANMELREGHQGEQLMSDHFTATHPYLLVLQPLHCRANKALHLAHKGESLSLPVETPALGSADEHR